MRDSHIILLKCSHIPPAPSAAPTSLRVSALTSSSITVQWGAVNCIHRNGDITGYSVRHGVVGSAHRQTRSFPGNEATISSLMPSTTYSIEVAAENFINIGQYSSAVYQLTAGMYGGCSKLHHNNCYAILFHI